MNMFARLLVVVGLIGLVSGASARAAADSADAAADAPLGDVAAFSLESAEQQWTDISEKKLESQMEQRRESDGVDVKWEALEREGASKQRSELNFVHEVRQHPAKTHVARGQMNVMSVREEDVREINLGGVKKPETGSTTASVLTLVGVAFAVIVFIFVVIRLRSSRGGATGNDAVDRGVIGGDDYHWVDELNIIVNPLEEQGKSGSLDDEDQESPLREDLSEDFSDSDRELDLEQGEGEEFSTDEDDDVPGVAVTSGRNVKELRSCRGLEWDDSTI